MHYYEIVVKSPSSTDVVRFLLKEFKPLQWLYSWDAKFISDRWQCEVTVELRTRRNKLSVEKLFDKLGLEYTVVQKNSQFFSWF